MTIYVVLVDDTNLSSEGYKTFEEAENFILSRSDEPKKLKSWQWAYSSSKQGFCHFYAIREITIK